MVILYFYAMKHISILVPNNAILGSLEGSRQVFSQVNEFFRMKGLPPVFKVQLVGLAKQTLVSGGLFTVNTDVLIDDVESTHLIVIPAIDGDLSQAIESNKDLLPWIVRQHASGAEVASLCLGAFILASTGLLKGKKCATHWLAENTFQKMFPEIQLVTEKIITDEHGLYSSGGAFSYLNLILYLIEKYVGREMAVMSAKVFAIELDRNSQLSFTVFEGQKSHSDESVKRVQQFIEANYQSRITIDQLADMIALGRRNLERRFKKATSNTIAEYIQRVKIEAAKISLESSTENVNEVMYKVGYTDNKAFRTTFKKLTGLSPIQYRSKYYRQQAS
jgi:transcriptional regulator GlxA family with amidase domain